MKALALLIGLASLSACATPEANGDVATYDTLKVARAACLAKGRELVLNKEGDEQRISAYTCQRK